MVFLNKMGVIMMVIVWVLFFFFDFVFGCGGCGGFGKYMVCIYLVRLYEIEYFWWLDIKYNELFFFFSVERILNVYRLYIYRYDKEI